MFEIYKTTKISDLVKADVETMLKGASLEEILETCQTMVQDTAKYDVEARCCAAAIAVVVVDQINAERAHTPSE